MMVQLYVDFNAVDADGCLSTLTEFASEPSVITPGAMLIVGDEEGNSAKARILSVDAGLVRLELQAGSFIAATDRPA